MPPPPPPHMRLLSLDVQTARFIIDKCLKGDILAGRTVILITHHIAMAGPAADFLVTLHDGRVKAQGTVNEVLKHDTSLFVEEKLDEGQPFPLPFTQLISQS